MNKVLQRFYSLLPVHLRTIPVSLWGYHLRRWRYGPETGRLVEETLRREHWTADQWEEWQAGRLAHLLSRAATRVPYYRAQWESGARQGEIGSRAELGNWPVLEKEVLRRDPRSFLADDCSPRNLYLEHTSGTTGTPLTLWQSRQMLQSWYAIFEARSRRWYGVSRNNRWAILGGQMVVPFKQRRAPFWVWNAAFKQLHLSSYHLAPGYIPDYLRALRRYRVTYLLGYTSALYELAQGVLHAGRSDLQMKIVVTNAEPVFDYQRRVISEAFGCPVRETYGMSEYAAAAGECEAGRLHLWPDVGIVEVVEDGQPVAAGSPGELVVTGLLNTDMPLIRYRVGDRGVLAPPGTSCECGRSLPIVESIDGRTDDVLYALDGRRIGRLDPVFKDDLPIHEAQIIQETLQRLRVRYVPAPGFTSTHGRKIQEYLRARMGNIEVILEEVAQIPRSANGKFRAVICKIPSPPQEPGNVAEALESRQLASDSETH